MFAQGSIRYLAPAAAAFAAALAGALLLPSAIAWTLAAVLAALFAFFLWFFRDPERSIGEAVVSPADGRVLAAQAEGDRLRLSIFMTPLSVHVNRAPVAGRLDALEYHQGSHVPAFRKESDRNERLEVDLSTPRGPVRVRLIAGTVARRIHPYLSPGAEVKKGDRIGLIAFGSRCELLLPARAYRLTARPGEWVRAGETPVATEVS